MCQTFASETVVRDHCDHIVRTHAIEIPLGITETFALFTPRGEMLWIEDWKPDFIYPADGTTCETMVFRTGFGAEETWWSCTEWAPEKFRVRYARVTPASRFAHVRVACAPLTTGRTKVDVRYTLTALNDLGRKKLEEMSPVSFANTIEHWKTLIERALPAIQAQA
jgi:hypothetical protein